MKQKIANYVLNVVESNGPLKILQITYGVVGTVSLVVAGLVSLVNQSLGWGLLIIPLVTFVAVGLNTVTWALLRLCIDSLAAQKLRELEQATAAKAKAQSARKPKAKAPVAKTAAKSSKSAKTTPRKK